MSPERRPSSHCGKMTSMRVTYDSEADAAYIALKPTGPGEARRQVPVKSDEAAGKIILDLDGEGRLIGVEVLKAARGLPRELLDQAERP